MMSTKPISAIDFILKKNGTVKNRLSALILCILFVWSCAHTKSAGMKPAAGQRYYYTATDYLNYEVAGEGKIPLIFLHGLGASLHSWDDVLPCIPGDMFTSYLIDLKGFGLSSKPRDAHYSIKDNAEIICRFLMDKRLSNFVLVGHSLGGAITLAVAVRSLTNPLLKPGAIVLIDAAAYKTDPPFFVRLARIPGLGKLLFLLPSSEFKARFVLKKVIYDQAKITPVLIARYRAFMEAEGYSGVLFKTAAALNSDDYELYVPNYSGIPYPVLVLWGTQDSAIPVSFADQLTLDIPMATIHTIDGCGHNPHEEFPEEVAELIIATAVEVLH